jgi:hypothetical protein
VRRLAAAFTAKTRPIKVAIARTIPLFALAAVFFVALYLPPAARTDQPSYDTVGAIEGEAISVQGPLNIEVVQGRTRTILRSGSDIRVHSGQARIELIEGGDIAVCGPAHLSVLKSVNLLTLALDSGTIHAHIEGSQPALTIYTAQLQAKPFAIGDAPRDTLVGFDQTGAMCIRADRGAVRVEQQLTAQSIVVPQSGEVLITNGQLESIRSGVTHCSCELQLAQSAPSPPEVSRLPTPEEMQKANTAVAKPSVEGAKTSAATPKPSQGEGPVYQVFMPPLSYDASAKPQRDNFDAQLIVLVRRVRVRPTLIFQGRVEGDPVGQRITQDSAPPTATAKPATQTPPANPQNNDSLISRVRAFFHRLFS